MLTWAGLVGAVLTCVGYWLVQTAPAFYALAIGGLFLNWLGDSLDGSIARHRGTERPQYGFFLDHTVDAFAMTLVAGGIAFSPMAHFWCASLALMGYYILTTLSLTTCLATGVFRVSYARIGPTEIRLGIAIATVGAALFPIGHVNVAGWNVTVYDLALLVLATAFVVTAIVQTYATARQQAIIDPPHPAKKPPRLLRSNHPSDQKIR